MGKKVLTLTLFAWAVGLIPAWLLLPEYTSPWTHHQDSWAWWYSFAPLFLAAAALFTVIIAAFGVTLVMWAWDKNYPEPGELETWHASFDKARKTSDWDEAKRIADKHIKEIKPGETWDEPKPFSGEHSSFGRLG